MKFLIIYFLCVFIFFSVLISLIGFIVNLDVEARKQDCLNKFGSDWNLSTVDIKYCVNQKGEIKYL